MLASDLETILLPEDIALRATVHCLACKQRLGWISYVEERGKVAEGAGERTISLALQADRLRDHRQGEDCVVLLCRCGQASTYHVL